MVAFHDHVLFCSLVVLSQDLRFWAKPINTLWFSIFFLIEHIYNRWAEKIRCQR